MTTLFLVVFTRKQQDLYYFATIFNEKGSLSLIWGQVV
jgi:hypothetical protein